MARIQFASLCATLYMICSQAASANRPNVLFIISDDLGWGEVGIYSSTPLPRRISTPNIDALLTSGVRFTSAYSGSPVCAPSRNALLVGQHTGHTWVRGNVVYDGHDLPLRPEDITLPMVLRDAGYATALVGKWGLGYNGTTGAAWLKGFDRVYGQLDQNNCHNMYPSPPMGFWSASGAGAVVNHTEYPNNANASRKECMAAGNNCTWSHDLYTDVALEILAEQAAAGPDAPPLFLVLSYTDPHAGGWGGVAETGAPVPSDGVYANETWPIVERDHASVISTYQDRDVGRVVAALESSGLRSNTLVLFASDNGAHNEGGHSVTFFNSSGPHRGFKRSLYEGGFRIPAGVSMPGTIPAGVVSDSVWAFWDVLPTVAAFAGVPPASLPPGLDGVSVEDAWRGVVTPRTAPLYWEFCTVHSPGSDGPTPSELAAMRAGAGAPATWGHAVRDGDWKIVSFAVGDALELYNVTADPSERNNVAAAHPDVVSRLEAIAVAAHVDNPYFPVVNCVGS